LAHCTVGTRPVVKASDVTALPFKLGAALRGRKFFHPSGVVAEGALERLAADDDGLPMASGPIVARVSKGVGLPGGLPDVGGLAWRMPATPDSDGGWDVLLASVAGGAWSRVLLRPLASWSDATFSTLMPFEYAGRSWWLRATITTPIPEPGLRLNVIADHIARHGLDVDVEQAPGTEQFRPLARLRLREVTPLREVSFDPVLNQGPPGVRLRPHWLTELRRAAYRDSRAGRDGTPADGRLKLRGSG
jgi:hypothetical protein